MCNFRFETASEIMVLTHMTWVSLNTAATPQMKTPWTSTSTPQLSLPAALQVLLGKLVINWVMALKSLLKELPACTIDFMVVAVTPVWGRTVRKWAMTDITQTMMLNGCLEDNTDLELDHIYCCICHVRGTTKRYIFLKDSASDTKTNLFSFLRRNKFETVYCKTVPEFEELKIIFDL